jgi:hypothetical protein
MDCFLDHGGMNAKVVEIEQEHESLDQKKAPCSAWGFQPFS